MLARQFLRGEAQGRCQEQKLEEIFAGAISLDKDVTGQYETPTMKKGHRQHQGTLEGKSPSSILSNKVIPVIASVILLYMIFSSSPVYIASTAVWTLVAWLASFLWKGAAAR